jgi:hypothetical protein
VAPRFPAHSGKVRDEALSVGCSFTRVTPCEPCPSRLEGAAPLPVRNGCTCRTTTKRIGRTVNQYCKLSSSTARHNICGAAKTNSPVVPAWRGRVMGCAATGP